MVGINSEVSDSIITSMSAEEAYKILGIIISDDLNFVQMRYHKMIFKYQDKEENAAIFARLRVAYEVILKYLEKPENPKQIIDVSYLSEAIENLAYLQEIRSRRIKASREEEEFFENYSEPESEDADDAEDDETDEPEIPDFGYPDEGEAESILKRIESIHFKSKKDCFDSILAEGYYQMIFTAAKEKQYDYAKKALDADPNKEKDVEYLYQCGNLLWESNNRDNIRMAIGYLSEAEKRDRRSFREKEIYYDLYYYYDFIEDYKSAFKYAKKLVDSFPENLQPYRMLGDTAYDLLTKSCNRMYADAAVKAFFLVLDRRADFWKDTWVAEKICKIYTRSSNWGMLEKICGEPNYTLLNKFAFNYYMGIARMNRGKTKEALQFFLNAYNLKCDHYDHYDYTLYANISRCYEEIDYEKALEWMKEFQQFRFRKVNYPKECMMHLFIRKKRFDKAKNVAEQFNIRPDEKALMKFRIDFCEACSDEERRSVIERVRKYMPYIQETEQRSEKNGYHVKRGSVWSIEAACRIGDMYWFVLNDDEMAIQYYELSVALVDYWSEMSDKYENPKLKASYGHYMLMRIFARLGKHKKMQEHADAFMDYIKEYYSDDDSKPAWEQYITALNEFAPLELYNETDYIYIKPSGEMGTEYSGDYNACKLAGYYLALGKIEEARTIAVNLARKYKKNIPAKVYVLMGDLAQVQGDTKQAKHMYRLAIEKNPWEGMEGIRSLYY
ncbi:MAG: tetratricopeptide repeat protein [Lachnospiraceae bacterium]